jgi:hypothetical protein
MSLRVALKLETASPTKVMLAYDPRQNRLMVKQLHHIDPQLLSALRRSTGAAKLQPEGIGVKKSASVDEAWGLLQHYSRQSASTCNLVDWAFTRIFEEITLESESGPYVELNEITSGQRVHFRLASGSTFWVDQITKVSPLVDEPQPSPA